jgi:hypothetical protein
VVEWQQGREQERITEAQNHGERAKHARVGGFRRGNLVKSETTRGSFKKSSHFAFMEGSKVWGPRAGLGGFRRTTNARGRGLACGGGPPYCEDVT